MSKVKTTAVIAGTAPLPGATEAAPPPVEIVDPPSGTSEAKDAQPPQPAAPIPEVPTPNRPGLETPQVQIAETDPFTLLRAWKLTNEQGSATWRSLRAMPVPGGCIVRLSAAAGSQLSESICFVPGVSIHNGALVTNDKPAT